MHTVVDKVWTFDVNSLRVRCNDICCYVSSDIQDALVVLDSIPHGLLVRQRVRSISVVTALSVLRCVSSMDAPSETLFLSGQYNNLP